MSTKIGIYSEASHAKISIAADLGTVEKTVKVHRALVMEKVKAASLAELVRLAHRVGIQPL